MALEDDRTLSQPVITPSEHTLPLRDLVEMYVRYQIDMGLFVDASANAVRSDMRGLARYLDDRGLPVTLQSFTTRHISSYLASKRSQIQGATMKRWFKSLKGFGRWAADRDYLPKNPVDGIRLGMVVINRREFLFEPSEARHFLEISCATGLIPEVDRVLRCLGLFAGLRRNEYLKLRWRHVHLAEAELWIFDSKGTRRKGHPDLLDRIIPTCPPLTCALKALHAIVPNGPDDPVLVSSRLKPLGKDAFSRIFARIWSAVGHEDQVPHSLRHNLAGSLLAVGASHADVALVLGHRHSSPDGRPSTTDSYISSSLVRVRSFLNRYAEQVLGGQSSSDRALGNKESHPSTPVLARDEAVNHSLLPASALRQEEPCLYLSPKLAAEALVLWQMMFPGESLLGAGFHEFIRALRSANQHT